ncbi:MAG TPA: DUF2490 domain-containing protein [Cyclobacteriaceae bacterium]
MGNRTFAIFAISLITQASFAQLKNVQRNNQQWIQYYGQIELTDKWNILPDGGFRWQDRFNEKGIFIARIGVGYDLNKKLRVTTGIASTGAYSPTGLRRLEFRPYQELFSSSNLGKLRVHHRLRIEERFYKRILNGDIVNGHDFNFRFRYQFSLSIQIIKIDYKNPNRILSLNVSDEIFINAGKEIVYNYLDKNRLVIGPSVQWNKNINVGIFYNFQFSQLNTPMSYAIDDVIWFTIRHHMNIAKAE